MNHGHWGMGQLGIRSFHNDKAPKTKRVRPLRLYVRSGRAISQKSNPPMELKPENRTQIGRTL